LRIDSPLGGIGRLLKLGQIAQPIEGFRSAHIAERVVARNSEYRALKEFTRLMHASDSPGMELPGMDIPEIATSYRVQSERVTSLSDLTRAVKNALSADKPRLIEISQRRLADS